MRGRQAIPALLSREATLSVSTPKMHQNDAIWCIFGVLTSDARAGGAARYAALAISATSASVSSRRAAATLSST